jgi:hypothetical protein
MAQTKLKYEINQRAITHKIRNAEYLFLGTALLLNYTYHPMKFQVHGFYKLGEMAWTKIKYENKQRAITQKLGSAEYRFLCTTIFLNEIYHPMKFQVHSFSS